MKQVHINDITLTSGNTALSFREKIEIVRHLDNLCIDVINMPHIENEAADSLLIRTVSAFVKNSTVCVNSGMTAEEIKTAANAVSGSKKSRLKINIPVSSVLMEYKCHKKAPKMLAAAKEAFSEAVKAHDEVEFCAMDATRADKSFLTEMINSAAEAGVKVITLCNDEGNLLPDEFSEFIENTVKENPVLKKLKLGISCSNTNGMASAAVMMAMKSAVDEIECSVVSTMYPELNVIAGVINNSGERLGVFSGINYNEAERTAKQIKRLIHGANGCADEQTVKKEIAGTQNNTALSADDSIEVVTDAVKKLGYDLSDEDYQRVYDEFLRVAEKKTVGAKELDAVVASAALQVEPTYKLISYVINNGNIISASAQIKLEKDGKEISGICIGDGPIDASFRAIEQIIGHHFELDDFQIQAVTEGREAVGSTLVRLRHNGKLYSGNGISTDIIGSSIRAYINAVNKIVYEEV